VGMQVSRVVDTEVSEEELVWGVAEVLGINIPRARRLYPTTRAGRSSPGSNDDV
jgi:hypothetical protein